MDALELLLSVRRSVIWERFRGFRNRILEGVNLPEDPMEALQLGYHIGLKAGYGEGLIDGVDLGMDVCSLTSSASVATWPYPVDIA